MANSLSDPATPGSVAILSPQTPQTGALAVTSTLTGSGILGPIDAAHPATLLGSVNVGSGLNRGTCVVKDGIVAGVGSNKLFLIDFSTPSTPVVLNSGGTTVNTGVGQCAAWGRYIATAGNTGGGTGTLTILDISNAASPTAVSSNFAFGATGSAINSMRIYGNHLFIANFGGTGIGALIIIDVTDPAAPVVTSTTNINNATDAILIANGRYCAVNAGGSLFVYDVSNLLSPSQVYTGTAGGIGSNTQGTCAFDHYIGITGQGTNTLYIVDVVNPTAPSVVGNVVVGVGALQVEPLGRYLAVSNTTDSSISLVDATVPTTPVVAATISPGVPVRACYPVGRTLVALGQNGVCAGVQLGPTHLVAGQVRTLHAGYVRVDGRAEARALIASERLAVGMGGATVGGSLAVHNDVLGRHIGGAGPALTAGNYVVQAAAGTGASSTGSGGTDRAGLLSLQTGTVSWATGAQVIVTFGRAYQSPPIVQLTPTNAAAAAAWSTRQVYITTTASTWSLTFGLADTAQTTYTWSYIVDGH